MPEKSTLLSVASIIIGVVFALLISEVTVRVVEVASPLAYLPNAQYGWSHTPNDEYVQKYEDYSVDIQINSQGLRDIEFPYDKPANVHRTLVLGDSFAEAKQVPSEASFPKLVQRALNGSRTNDETTYEVLNAGTSGYGTDNALLFFRHEGYRYGSDVVLLALYIGNDIRNNWYPLENIDAGGFRKPYFVPGNNSIELKSFPFDDHATLMTRIKVFLNRHFHLYSLLRETRDRLRSRSTTDDGSNTGQGINLDSFLFQTEYSPDWNTAWQVTKKLILQLRDEAEEHKAKLVVVIIPTQFQVYNKYWRQRIDRSPAMLKMSWDLDKPNTILDSFLEANEIAYLDLLPVFRRSAAEVDQEFYILLDGHWNESGHKLAAEHISSKLNEAIHAN